MAALAAACAAELADAELRVVQQAHENCFDFDESGNPPVGDDDEDGFCNDEDTCPFIANDQSADADGDANTEADAEASARRQAAERAEAAYGGAEADAEVEADGDESRGGGSESVADDGVVSGL